MNIKQAKEQIKNAMTAYFEKDDYGEYMIPEEEQRPVFLIGAPGIGKTAIMQQIAQELGVGLVSYSMTHHTRQSALGLPYIEKKTYGGQEYSVSEYTMSEIIASVYDLMEATDVTEGILFIDEINCVSETLAPSMLQFLQYKVFGRHKVPHGWIVVTAGNPPEYNNSVREFDIVTWDRLKVIDVEPNYDVWKEYAYKKGVHPAIMTYLDIKKDDFYKIETTVDGKSYVTARGWTDLSNMIRLLEKKKISVDRELISQYIRHSRTSKDFSIYYDLFKKYKSDYQVTDILAGIATEDIKQRAQSAKFDERLSLLGLILDGLNEHFKEAFVTETALTEYMAILKEVNKQIKNVNVSAADLVTAQAEKCRKNLEREKKISGVSADKLTAAHKVVQCLESLTKQLKMSDDEQSKEIKKNFKSETDHLREISLEAGKMLDNAFFFCEDVFGEGQEMIILVTELTINFYSSHFITRYGCKKYFEYNKAMLFYERRKELAKEILSLDEEI
ncbi:MAG: MoxR family ATPase [Ruminococcus sp.]|nr:MoxR family ATPase [Ruminococcus sp.]